ncbi:MAG: exodeoxyribonuclease VII large subunit [Deltaproteobacteria bacterium]|nr:exodeoxyribonuclease VII large subunit [Deltaproteobacteria bacterium]MBW2018428.1 exodeoxyribonuclease VII large subunit [Deltaproteobacteria bacterium]MBW2073715.1 exodeoxyribonuclease VII large subunit [Deltaproteobacteria bacterium]RLB83588.1 MAG: exodeoxyribonuclease VII large subunit [Deltaproteobacteria bacterium]
MDTDSFSLERRIYTVSELTQRIKSLLEESYPFVWIIGEISNFSTPASGHYYFTLRDSEAQISAVMFRAQNRNLKFKPEDGCSVIALGRLNVYEPKGVYQIIIEYLEPEGIGILQLAFEQLKAKLAAEGLFDEKHKRSIPFLPHKIAVVTSPTGAVIRDIMHVLDRRFPNVAIEIAPAKVQGEGAAEEIAAALQLLNERDDVDVIVVARGGGSLEDLQAFNSEVVARAIFSSHIPVVSAVGHETDFTIADLTADVRAATPSAAAELIVPVKEELLRRIEKIRDALKRIMLQRLRLLRERTTQLSRRLVHPSRQIADHRLRLDDAFGRILQGFSRQLDGKRDRLSVMQERLDRCSPQVMIGDLNVLLKHHCQTLFSAMRFYLKSKSSTLRTTVAKLNALSPLAILERGYSVTRTLPDYALVKHVQQVSVGQQVEVTVSRGAMVCRIERKRENGQANI